MYILYQDQEPSRSSHVRQRCKSFNLLVQNTDSRYKDAAQVGWLMLSHRLYFFFHISISLSISIDKSIISIDFPKTFWKTNCHSHILTKYYYIKILRYLIPAILLRGIKFEFNILCLCKNIFDVFIRNGTYFAPAMIENRYLRTGILIIPPDRVVDSVRKPWASLYPSYSLNCRISLSFLKMLSLLICSNYIAML